jgi:hypothetical protein
MINHGDPRAVQNGDPGGVVELTSRHVEGAHPGGTFILSDAGVARRNERSESELITNMPPGMLG